MPSLGPRAWHLDASGSFSIRSLRLPKCPSRSHTDWRTTTKGCPKRSSNEPKNCSTWCPRNRGSDALKCSEFAGQYLCAMCSTNIVRLDAAGKSTRNTCRFNRLATALSMFTAIYLVDPDWLTGAPGHVNGVELGGYADASVEATSAWYKQRLQNLRLIEVRGRIKLAEDTSASVMDGRSLQWRSF